LKKDDLKSDTPWRREVQAWSIALFAVVGVLAYLMWKK
jgi:hypothetical protein